MSIVAKSAPKTPANSPELPEIPQLFINPGGVQTMWASQLKRAWIKFRRRPSGIYVYLEYFPGSTSEPRRSIYLGSRISKHKPKRSTRTGKPSTQTIKSRRGFKVSTAKSGSSK